MRGILTNPVYAGRIYAERTRYRPARIRRSATRPIGHPHDSAVPLPQEEWIAVASVPAVVSQEHFDLVREKLSKNKSFARRNNKTHEYLLRALVSCGTCMLCSVARTQTGKNVKQRQRYYVCSGKFKEARSYLEEKCPSRYAPADQLDEVVWKDLCEVLSHPESITDALQRAHGDQWLPQELKVRQENLRQGRAALGRQLERLTGAYLGEVIPLAEYQRRRQDLERRDAALASQERQLRAHSHQHMKLAGIVGSVEDFCERVRSGLADATFEQRRKLVELLIDRVIVTDEEVEIRYVIPTDSSSEQVRFCHLRSDYLHHPPFRGLKRSRLALLGDHAHQSTILKELSGHFRVVGTIEMYGSILGQLGGSLYSLQRSTQKRRVVAVRRSAQRPKRDALGVHRHRAFEALLSPIHRASARLLSSARGLGDAAVHGHIEKIEADGPIVGFARHLLQVVHHPDFYPLVAPAPERGSRAQLIGDPPE